MASERQSVRITISTLFVIVAAICMALFVMSAVGWLPLNLVVLAGLAALFWLLSLVGL